MDESVVFLFCYALIEEQFLFFWVCLCVDAIVLLLVFIRIFYALFI